MGSLHARVIAGNERAELEWIVEPNRERGEQLSRRFQSKWLESPDLDSVDAVILATPTQFHFDTAHTIIERGQPLLLEKPLAESIDESRRLVDLARERQSVLACGLLERFNPAVRTAAEICRDPVHVATVRHSPYAERIRTGVAGDLLIHDVDLVVRLFGGPPTSVAGHCSVLDPRSLAASEDVGEATLRFGQNRLAALSASRISQRKVRTLTITELDRLIEVDLLRQDITVYRHVQTTEFDEDAGYSQQTIIDIPVIRHLGEPLQLQLNHFLALVSGDADRVVEIDGLLTPHEVVDQIRGSNFAGPIASPTH